MDTIKLSVVLADLDSELTPAGKPVTFSIKFIKKNGELVFIRKAIKVGLARMNLFENAFRGVVKYGISFPELIFNKEATQIVGINTINARHCRFLEAKYGIIRSLVTSAKFTYHTRLAQLIIHVRYYKVIIFRRWDC
jgi:hypothetical protein